MSYLYSKLSYKNYRLIQKKFSIENITKLEKSKKLIFGYFPIEKNKINAALKAILKVKNISIEQKEDILASLSLFQASPNLEKILEKGNIYDAYSNFLAIVNYAQIEHIDEISLNSNEKLEVFLVKLVNAYLSEMEYNVWKIENKRKQKTLNKDRNYLPIRNLIKDNYKKGKSYSAERINKILRIISEQIETTNVFVFDDPFEGMDNKTILDFSNLFCRLIKKDFRFIILTNNLQALRCLKNCDWGKKISVALIEEDDLSKKKFHLEEVNKNVNLIFKYNDLNYYDDLKKFFENPTISPLIKNILFAYHRQVLWETEKILSCSKDWNADKNSNLMKVYNDMAGVAKLELKNNILKGINKEEYNWAYSRIANKQRFELLNLFIYNKKSDFSIYLKYGEIMLIRMIAKLSFQSLYDDYSKLIEEWIQTNKYINNQDSLQLLKNKIKDFEQTRNLLSHPKEHVLIWAELMIEDEYKWIEFFIILENIFIKHKFYEFDEKLKEKIKRAIKF